MSDAAQALANYAALLAKVDAKFTEIQAAAGPAMRCGAGCHSCCLPGLSVNDVEAEHLRSYVAARPALAEKLTALAAADPHGGTRCALLDASGRCSVYEARPVVCRSHGVPIEVKGESGRKQKDVCPLNFRGTPVADLPSSMILNLDLLNTLLALIDAQFRGKAGTVQGPRTPLTVAALTSLN